MLRYSVYLEEPTLDSYRLSYCPREDYAVAFICPFAVVTDASGKMYNSLRGLDGEVKGLATNYGFFELNGQLDESGPLLYSYREIPNMEPYWVKESADSVHYIGKNFQFDFRVDGYDWYDAKGRWELTTKRLGQACTFWVPAQGEYKLPQMLRSHMAKATGTINGERVEGLFMLDIIYSHPATTFFEVPMVTKLHNLWLNWLVEYTDGSYEGGYAWRGRPGTGFAAAHHVVGGVSTGRTDAVIESTYTERGTVKKNILHLGNEVTVELAQYGNCDWPIHSCGHVVSTSRDKEIAKSWNYTEFMPLNAQEMMTFQQTYREFIGQAPRLGRIYKEALVRDGYLVFPKGVGSL
jgi:hypothetical protein